MVNIKDFSSDVIPIPTKEKDRLHLIFERQASLMVKYKDIYKTTGFDYLTDKTPTDLHTAAGQNIIKYYAWCTVEEVAEAIEASFKEDKLHMMEELIDGLHFLTECSIYAGFDPDSIAKTGRTDYPETKHCILADTWDILNTFGPIQEARFVDYTYSFIGAIGTAMNCLKQKPWKQTHILTDVDKFQGILAEAWVAYIGMLKCANLTPDDILAIYFKKSEVNKFRQGSNY